MNFKPADIYLSIVDFFAVFLPGALVVFGLACGTDTWITQHILNNNLLPDIEPLGQAGKISAFIFSSYIVGSFVSLIGSLFEDVINYRRFYWITRLCISDYNGVDKLRECAEKVMNCNVGQRIFDYPKEEKISLIRQLFQSIKKLFGVNSEPNDHNRKRLYMRRLINASLRVNSPAAMTEIDHMEATSKFFRNFAIALIIFLLYKLNVIWNTGLDGDIIVLIVLITLSVFLYLIQDYGRDRYFYIYFLLQEKMKKPEETVITDKKHNNFGGNVSN